MTIPWYIHGNWILESTQLTTLENNILKGETKQKEDYLTTYYTEKLFYLDFLYNFYKERVDEIAKSQLLFKYYLINFSFWVQVYNKKAVHPVHDHFGASNVVSFVHFLRPIKNNCFSFTDGEQLVIPQQEEGDFLVFPSYVPHQINSHKTDKNRLVVAGNIYIKKYE